MAEVKTVTDETFEQDVLNAERPVIVDFWAAWCGPCRMVAPELDKIAQKYEGSVDVVKLDVDANPMISQALGIQSLPTVVFFRPGAQPLAMIGARPAAQYESSFGLAEYATLKS